MKNKVTDQTPANLPIDIFTGNLHNILIVLTEEINRPVVQLKMVLDQYFLEMSESLAVISKSNELDDAHKIFRKMLEKIYDAIIKIPDYNTQELLVRALHYNFGLLNQFFFSEINQKINRKVEEFATVSFEFTNKLYAILHTNESNKETSACNIRLIDNGTSIAILIGSNITNVYSRNKLASALATLFHYIIAELVNVTETMSSQSNDSMLTCSRGMAVITKLVSIMSTTELTSDDVHETFRETIQSMIEILESSRNFLTNDYIVMMVNNLTLISKKLNDDRLSHLKNSIENYIEQLKKISNSSTQLPVILNLINFMEACLKARDKESFHKTLKMILEMPDLNIQLFSGTARDMLNDSLARVFSLMTQNVIDVKMILALTNKFDFADRLSEINQNYKNGSSQKMILTAFQELCEDQPATYFTSEIFAEHFREFLKKHNEEKELPSVSDLFQIIQGKRKFDRKSQLKIKHLLSMEYATVYHYRQDYPKSQNLLKDAEKAATIIRDPEGIYDAKILLTETHIRQMHYDGIKSEHLKEAIRRHKEILFTPTLKQRLLEDNISRITIVYLRLTSLQSIADLNALSLLSSTTNQLKELVSILRERCSKKKAFILPTEIKGVISAFSDTCNSTPNNKKNQETIKNIKEIAQLLGPYLKSEKSKVDEFIAKFSQPEPKSKLNDKSIKIVKEQKKASTIDPGLALMQSIEETLSRPEKEWTLDVFNSFITKCSKASLSDKLQTQIYLKLINIIKLNCTDNNYLLALLNNKLWINESERSITPLSLQIHLYGYLYLSNKNNGDYSKIYKEKIKSYQSRSTKNSQVDAFIKETNSKLTPGKKSHKVNQSKVTHKFDPSLAAKYKKEEQKRVEEEKIKLTKQAERRTQVIKNVCNMQPHAIPLLKQALSINQGLSAIPNLHFTLKVKGSVAMIGYFAYYQTPEQLDNLPFFSVGDIDLEITSDQPELIAKELDKNAKPQADLKDLTKENLFYSIHLETESGLVDLTIHHQDSTREMAAMHDILLAELTFKNSKPADGRYLELGENQYFHLSANATTRNAFEKQCFQFVDHDPNHHVKFSKTIISALIKQYELEGSRLHLENYKKTYFANDTDFTISTSLNKLMNGLVIDYKNEHTKFAERPTFIPWLGALLDLRFAIKHYHTKIIAPTKASTKFGFVQLETEFPLLQPFIHAFFLALVNHDNRFLNKRFVDHDAIAKTLSELFLKEILDFDFNNATNESRRFLALLENTLKKYFTTLEKTVSQQQEEKSIYPTSKPVTTQPASLPHKGFYQQRGLLFSLSPNAQEFKPYKESKATYSKRI